MKQSTMIWCGTGPPGGQGLLLLESARADATSARFSLEPN